MSKKKMSVINILPSNIYPYFPVFYSPFSGLLPFPFSFAIHSSAIYFTLLSFKKSYYRPFSADNKIKNDSFNGPEGPKDRYNKYRNKLYEFFYYFQLEFSA